MKLATLHDGSRDGQLAVVSRDLTTAHFASGIATRLQALLDDWNFVSPQLEDLYATLNGGKARHAFPFDPRQCLAPLPRAYGLAVARGGEVPPAVWPSDALGAPHDDVPVPPPGDEAAAAEASCEAMPAAVTAGVAAGAGAEQALDSVRLLLLAAVWGHGAPAAFAPLAVTPDELGTAWRGGRVHLSMHCREAGADAPAVDTTLASPFGRCLAVLARRRRVGAGLIVAVPCGAAVSLRAGQTAWIDARAADGRSVFGHLAQRLVPPPGAPGSPSTP